MSDAGIDVADRADTQSTDGSDGSISTATALGVNDVSYLFPLPKTATELPSLLAIDPNAVGPRFLTAPMMTELLKLGILPRVGADLRGQYRVIAMRVDPCAAVTAVADPSRCQSQVRLVAQPVGMIDGKIQSQDLAFHLLYQVPRADLDAMMAALLALKPAAENLAGVALGPHPIMVKQGLSGAFAKGVNDLIMRYVSPTRLLKVAMMGVATEPRVWDFALMEPAGGTLIGKPIAGFASMTPTSEVVMSVIVAAPGVGGAPDRGRMYVLPEPDQTLGFPSALMDANAAQALPPAALQTALRRLREIEDPTKSSVDKVDCASCHAEIEGLAYYQRLARVTAPPTFVGPPGQNITQTLPSNGDADNTRAFGYIDDRAAVSQRVINESARVAEWLSHGIR